MLGLGPLSHNQKRGILGATAAFIVAMVPAIAPDHAPYVVPIQTFVTGIAGWLTIQPDEAPPVPPPTDPGVIGAH